jgi:hypothetical protein
METLPYFILALGLCLVGWAILDTIWPESDEDK